MDIIPDPAAQGGGFARVVTNADMARQGSDELENRIFGSVPDPLPALQRPGIDTREQFAEQFMRQPGLPLTQQPPLLDQKELPRARALARVLSQLVQNTNITAGLPAHVQPPLWSDPVDLSARVTVPAAVGQYQNVISYKVPPGRWARISAYGVNVLDPAYTYDGSLLWRITVNGNPVPTLGDWGIQRGSIVQPRSTVITLREDWILGFDVRRAVVAAGTTAVDMCIIGWAWRYRFNYEGTKNVLTAQ